MPPSPAPRTSWVAGDDDDRILGFMLIYMESSRGRSFRHSRLTRSLYALCRRNHPHRVRNMVATSVLQVPESRVRVVCNDVGGGFGARVGSMSSTVGPWGGTKAGSAGQWRCE